MSVVTKRLSKYVKERNINISAMARDTKIPYAAIYNSLCDSERDRSLRDNELLAICSYLEVNPMNFADIATVTKN